MLGSEPVVDAARTAMASDYAFTGAADRMTAGLLSTVTAIHDGLAAYRDPGADEVLYCWSPDPDQVDRLADLVARPPDSR